MLPESRELQVMNDVLSHTQAGEQVIFLASFKDSAYTDRDSLILLTQTYYEGLHRACGQWIDTVMLQAGGGMEESLSEIVATRLPLFLTEKDYAALDTLTQPEHIRSTLAANKKILLSPASVVYKRMVAADPIGISGLVWSKLGALQFDPNYELYDGHIFSENGQRLTFFLKPKFPAAQTGINSRFFQALDAYNDSFFSAHPVVKITYFGGAAVAAGNATQMRTDTIVTLSVTVLLLMLLTFLLFQAQADTASITVAGSIWSGSWACL
jgi:predicted exporter